MLKKIVFTCVIMWISILLSAQNTAIPYSSVFTRQMENLDRGLVAVKVNNGVFMSWRLLGSDNHESTFKIYRDEELIAEIAADGATNYLDTKGTVSANYRVQTYVDGKLKETSKSVTPWANSYLAIQLSRPPAGVTPPNLEHDGKSGSTAVSYPNGQEYTYTPNDCSVADLDGDGEYEIIVKWDPSNSKDNSQTGITGNVYIDAYKLDGTQLWRIDLGKNIRAGAHYTQFMVYDFDGDGIAELICRTAPGTIDGEGNYVLLGSDSKDANYRNENLASSGNSRTGFILKGSEYLTLFDGITGKELHSVNFSPARGTVSSWGDSYGNRVDRFLACVAYLDGVHPSVVMCRGYYAKSMLSAYDVINKKLVLRWTYDSGSSSSLTNIYGQGFHSLAVGDVDEDGFDEIIYGASAIDHDGKFLYRTGIGHGDAMHLSDLDPDRPGLEVWAVHEDTSAAYGYEMHDAQTGKIIWGTQTGTDNGRGLAADIDKNHRGFEMWSSSGSGTYNVKGERISTKKPSINFRIYWDADLQDELLDGTTLTKWNGNGTNTTVNFNSLYPGGVSKINSTKSNPCISADIIGDWREEAVYYSTSDPSKIVLFTTTTQTTNRLYTPMHDPVYRLSIAWQNVAYNQPPHLGIYIGDGLQNIPQPNIYTPKYTQENTSVNTERLSTLRVKVQKGNIRIYSGSTSVQIQAVSVYAINGAVLYHQNDVNTDMHQFKIQRACSQYVLIRVVTNVGVKVFKIFNSIVQ